MSDSLSDYQLRQFDPTLAAMLDSLPFGWEVALHRNTQAMNEDTNIDVPTADESAQAKIDAARNQIMSDLRGAMFSMTRAHNGTIPTALGDGRYIALDDKVAIVFEGTKTTFVVDVRERNIYQHEWEQIALRRAQELLHEPTDVVMTGYPNATYISWCQHEGCAAMVRIPKDGAPIGTMYTDECKRGRELANDE